MEAAPNTLRILSFNIAHGRGLSLYQGFQSARRIDRTLARIADLLRSLRLDVVALQEVDEDSHWNRRINLLRALQESSGLPFAVMGLNNRRGGRRPLNYGNAFLSRHPVLLSENRPFGSASLGEKGFLYAEIALPGGTTPFLNLHLDFRSRAHRIHQVEDVIQFLERNRATGPAMGLKPGLPIICGDFNAGLQRAMDAPHRLRTWLEGLGPYHIFPVSSKTFPAHWPRRRIDFIFAPASYRVRHVEVIRSFLSDHRPILLEAEAPASLSSAASTLPPPTGPLRAPTAPPRPDFTGS